MSFLKAVAARQETFKTRLCLGLDPRPAEAGDIADTEGQRQRYADWCKRLIDLTADKICSIKPNSAFFEAAGPGGMQALGDVIAYAHEKDIPVLLDVKRGDIGSTAEAYASAAYDWLGADAVTLSPYMGKESVDPFLRDGKSAFLLCRTSNPSGAMLQEQQVEAEALYESVARLAVAWGDEIGFVVGATRPEAVEAIRRKAPDAWLLLPGLGAQGGPLEAAVRAAHKNMIFPVSRGIAQADDPAAEAENLRQEIEDVIEKNTPVTDETLTLEDKGLILDLARIDAVKFGEFTLASGKKSPVYVDLRLLASDMAVMKRAVKRYVRLVAGLEFDQVGAIPYAGMPIGTALALKTDKPLVYPRKEVKDHGRGRVVEGAFKEGDKVLIVEDVMTSGGSIIEGVEKLRDVGLVCKEAVVLLDRESGGADNLKKEKIGLRAAFTLTQVVDVLLEAGKITKQQHKDVKDFMKKG